MFRDEQGREYATECDCGKLEADIQNNKVKFAHVPETYKDARLKALTTRYYSQDGKKIFKSICDTIKFWLDHVDEMTEQGKGLYLWSQAKGSGKTMVASALTNELVEMGKHVKFTTSMDILDEIRASYDRETDTHESQLLSQLATCDYLVIDDMGTERATDWVSEKFYQIVNKRYINRKVTFYTSNYEARKLPYDDRISSRIIERTFLVHFPEESVREVKAGLENKING